MKLRFGFSPCPNDTFIVHHLLHDLATRHGISLEPVIEDVETLNTMALDNALDVSKLSFHAWLHIKDSYQLMQSGSALGFGVGPLLIGKRIHTDKEVEEGPIAIPGRYTTANLLFSLRYPNAMQKVIMPFDAIESAVLEGKVIGGVIIHENRFTYEKKGLVKTIDLGDYWESQTGAAIPLGGFFARHNLGTETIALMDRLLKLSVQAAFDNPTASAQFVRRYAREMEPDVIRQHIDLYVNANTLELGKTGRRAIQTLEEWAEKTSLLASMRQL
jgi:1,4-dihydroxy-6-naphthoate synthase